MAESSNCSGGSTGGVEGACPVGSGGVTGAGGGETSEGSEKSLGEEIGKAGEGCMESGACSSAVSLSCASLKVKARVQAGLLPAAIRAPGVRYPSPGKLKKKTWLQATCHGGRKNLVTEDRRVGGIDPVGEGQAKEQRSSGVM